MIKYMSYERFKKNVPNWRASINDYMLAFMWVNGYWREVSGNIPKYANMILADYLDEVGINLPDDCIFCRIKRDGEMWEYRVSGGLIRIFYKLRED